MLVPEFLQAWLLQVEREAHDAMPSLSVQRAGGRLQNYLGGNVACWRHAGADGQVLCFITPQPIQVDASVFDFLNST